MLRKKSVQRFEARRSWLLSSRAGFTTVALERTIRDRMPVDASGTPRTAATARADLDTPPLLPLKRF